MLSSKMVDTGLGMRLHHQYALCEGQRWRAVTPTILRFGMLYIALYVLSTTSRCSHVRSEVSSCAFVGSGQPVRAG